MCAVNCSHVVIGLHPFYLFHIHVHTVRYVLIILLILVIIIYSLFLLGYLLFICLVDNIAHFMRVPGCSQLNEHDDVAVCSRDYIIQLSSMNVLAMPTSGDRPNK